MAGAVDVETRGALEASEGAGGRGACDGSAMGEVVRGGGFRGSGEASVGQWGKSVWGMDAGPSAKATGSGAGKAVSDDRRGDGLV